MKRQRHAGRRVGEPKFARMQLHLPRAGTAPVERVTDDRDAEPAFVCGMDTQLVCAASDRDERDSSEFAFVGELLPVRDPEFSMQAHPRHLAPEELA